MLIGLIQTRGLGDIVIAVPIAMYYIERGCEVYWPIDSDFLPSFTSAFPKINFISVDKKECIESSADYFYEIPKKLLAERNCDAIICLYSHLTGYDLGHNTISESLTFDAYKYAVAKVPFSEKWRFFPKRNPIREASLFNILNISPNDDYAVVHENGSDFSKNIIDNLSKNKLPIIKIEPITENIFDWIGVIENSKELHLIDSVYANIVEQLSIKNKKIFYSRSPARFTPVLASDWTYQ